MVHIEDLGSKFDAPIETVWSFIQSEGDHGQSHSNRRNIQGAPGRNGTMKVSWEQNVDGRWVNVVNEVSYFPPVAMLVHSLEGPLSGSKFMFYYRPDGTKTVVNAVGEFQSPVIPPTHLEPMVLASFEEAFNEDNAAIRRMAAKK